MPKSWRAAALGAALLTITSCGGRATLGGPGAGHGGDPGADAASGGSDGAARADGGAPDDAGLVVTVTAQSPFPDLSRSVAVGATVALDTPGGERLEETTDAEGRAHFPAFDGTAGAATTR